MIHHSPNLEQQIPFDPDFDEADHLVLSLLPRDTVFKEAVQKIFEVLE